MNDNLRISTCKPRAFKVVEVNLESSNDTDPFGEARNASLRVTRLLKIFSLGCLGEKLSPSLSVRLAHVDETVYEYTNNITEQITKRPSLMVLSLAIIMAEEGEEHGHNHDVADVPSCTSTLPGTKSNWCCR